MVKVLPPAYTPSREALLQKSIPWVFIARLWCALMKCSFLAPNKTKTNKRPKVWCGQEAHVHGKYTQEPAWQVQPGYWVTLHRDPARLLPGFQSKTGSARNESLCLVLLLTSQFLYSNSSMSQSLFSKVYSRTQEWNRHQGLITWSFCWASPESVPHSTRATHGDPWFPPSIPQASLKGFLWRMTTCNMN